MANDQPGEGALVYHSRCHKSGSGRGGRTRCAVKALNKRRGPYNRLGLKSRNEIVKLAEGIQFIGLISGVRLGGQSREKSRAKLAPSVDANMTAESPVFIYFRGFYTIHEEAIGSILRRGQ
ncbi:hypothetical protein KM043_003570 [Ampulex compressa]|nr:hypothetical protein KM043_003570 [Ampulex compressa]